MFESILIAVAICLDTLALGITYGIRKIKMSKVAILIINIITVFILGVTVISGQYIRYLINESTATIISSFILFSLGSFLMLEGYLKHLKSLKQDTDSDKKLIKLRIPKLGIIIDIALDVTKADLDTSGDINLIEAIYIGFLLSVDSIGAGFGYAMGEINVLSFLLFVFLINLVSITSGLMIGRKIVLYKSNLITSLLPGLILVLIGLIKIIY